MVDVLLVSLDSNSVSNCVSTNNACHNTSPSTIRNWLVSLSKVTAVYALLVVRLGTRCDGKRLRKKVKRTRQKAISLMQLIQASLLPHITQDSFKMEPLSQNTIEYKNLFMFHCSCIEYFIEQLLRTLDLIVSFRLSYDSHSSQWPIEHRNPLIYSGFTQWGRSKRKCQQTNAREATRMKWFQNLSDQRIINKLKLSKITQNSISENSFTSSENEEKSHRYESESRSKRIKNDENTSDRILSFLSYDSEMHSSKLKNGDSLTSNHIYHHSKHNNKNQISSSEEFQDLEDLQKEIQVIKDLILKIYSKVQMNPWAIKPSRRKLASKLRQQKDVPIGSTTRKAEDSALPLEKNKTRGKPFDLNPYDDEDEDEEDEIGFSDDDESDVVSITRGMTTNRMSTYNSRGKYSHSSLKTTSLLNSIDQHGDCQQVISNSIKTPEQYAYVSIVNYRRQRVIRRRCFRICFVSTIFLLLLILAITTWWYLYTKMYTTKR